MNVRCARCTLLEFSVNLAQRVVVAIGCEAVTFDIVTDGAHLVFVPQREVGQQVQQPRLHRAIRLRLRVQRGALLSTVEILRRRSEKMRGMSPG